MLDPGSAHFFNPSQHRPARKTASQNPHIPTLQRHQTAHAPRQPPGSTGTHRTSATETLRNLQTKGQLQGRCHVHAAGLGPTLKIPSTRRHTLEILKCIEVRLDAIWTYFEEFSWNALKYNLFCGMDIWSQSWVLWALYSGKGSNFGFDHSMGSWWILCTWSFEFFLSFSDI